MKNRSINQALKVMVFLAIVTAFSSCNRGVGCPGNSFSTNISVVDVVQSISTAIINK